MNHYASKKAILRSVVEGIPARALCGELIDCQHQGGEAIPGSEVANQTHETCPDCEFFYGGLKADVEEDVKEPANVPAFS